MGTKRLGGAHRRVLLDEARNGQGQTISQPRVPGCCLKAPSSGWATAVMPALTQSRATHEKVVAMATQKVKNQQPRLSRCFQRSSRQSSRWTSWLVQWLSVVIPGGSVQVRSGATVFPAQTTSISRRAGRSENCASPLVDGASSILQCRRGMKTTLVSLPVPCAPNWNSIFSWRAPKNEIRYQKCERCCNSLLCDKNPILQMLAPFATSFDAVFSRAFHHTLAAVRSVAASDKCVSTWMCHNVSSLKFRAHRRVSDRLQP